ncbi:MAG: protein-export chaperone SecB [Gammaproteobacteria bacterium]
MAEENQPNPEKQLLLQKIYIKDFSFESPRAPEIFGTNVSPKTQISIKSTAKELTPDTQEVILTLTLEAKDQDKTLFMVEIEQAGQSRIHG